MNCGKPENNGLIARLENKQPWVDDEIGEVRDAHVEKQKVGGLQEEHLVFHYDENDGEVGQQSDDHDHGKHCKCNQTNRPIGILAKPRRSDEAGLGQPDTKSAIIQPSFLKPGNSS